jgi:hypothetical protein
MEIGLATLRRDGFGYLSRKLEKNAAHFVTAPFTTEGKLQLFVNLEGVRQDRPLTVELLDEFDRPLPGYSGDQAAQVTQPGTRTPVVFPGQQNSTLPAGKPLALRVTFPDSEEVKVYALYVGQ